GPAHHAVIPGRHEVVSSESITTNGDYGFRAPSLRSGPGMTKERTEAHIRLASRGSSRARRPSPNKFTASTTSASAMPGQKMVHGARDRNRRLCAIMFPQVGISGGVPAPRNDSAASIRIAEAQM